MSAVLLRNGARRQLSLLSSVLTAHRGVACRVSAPAAAEAVTSAVSSSPTPVVFSRHQPAPLGGARGFAAGSGLAGGAFVIRRVPQAAVPTLPSDGSGPGGSLAGVRCASAAALPQPPSPGRGLATSSTPFCNLAAGGGYSDFEEAPFGHPAPSFAASGVGLSAGDASESESEDDDVAIAQVGCCCGLLLVGSASDWVVLSNICVLAVVLPGASLQPSMLVTERWQIPESSAREGERGCKASSTQTETP